MSTVERHLYLTDRHYAEALPHTRVCRDSKPMLLSCCPPPYPTDTDSPTQAAERATEPRRDRNRADTHGGQAEPERGAEGATGGTGGEWDRVSQGESRRGCAGVILARGIGEAVERGRIVPQTVRATKSAQDRHSTHRG